MGTLFMEQFLHDLNCGKYVEAFKECEILNRDDIEHLDREILEELGVSKLGDRIRILNKAKLLRERRCEKLTDQLNGIIEKINSLSTTNMNVTDDLIAMDKHSSIFILNDGSAKKVNVNGCFNAELIKKRLIKRLPSELIALDQSGEETKSAEDYDVFVVNYEKNILHLLYDVELVTICHSSDRIEKNRLIFISKDQTPSDKALATSKKLYLRTLNFTNKKHVLQPENLLGSNNLIFSGYAQNENIGVGQPLKMDNTKGQLRRIFNQRPPSELISTNLTGYFPKADMKHLQKTLKDSFRQSVRLTNGRRRTIDSESNKVGDIILKHNTAVDNALLGSLPQNDPHSTVNNKISTTPGNPGHTQATADPNHIKLVPEIPDDIYDSENDIFSLPTTVSTPKAWLKGACIGSGSFGSVYLGMNATTGELMAVKQVEIPADILGTEMNINDKKKKSSVYKKMVDALQHEMNLLKELHHENIVTYYGSSQEGQNFNIFLEYVPGGSVSSMLKNYGPFEESLIINFTRQILIGVAYLHRKNIIHRDIKGANILIDIKGCVKITDFGISKKLSPLNKINAENNEESPEKNEKVRPQENEKINKRVSLQGSVYWMAPEVVRQTAATEKIDIWSTGCVIIEMYTGRHPFPELSQMQTIFKIGTNTAPELPSWASPNSVDFLKKTFEINYEKRPSAVELLLHPWLDARIK
ncbi:hypothetical protein TPHA_0B01010 [Tetrapisispora phaffii CBS 4417]|uniref:Serine/threonine-protein kinase STE11 n=1 Tax=Tetrapisispora phaffii (strain ATCC 24235 / CBS 4417 / NBRC 1672 / NRRL Y-8282 / UCD 70-5) TaxID=1071381 RepID=G8BQH6_TETPH|nr:hypothetical protein TPHA_0B01010 [Tetrapisispora phaffii CBS 4417]CCE61773.1 hypothetical protein TPHA_0B01010 [Tetrapisispora phaffii CBS 4417]